MIKKSRGKRSSQCNLLQWGHRQEGVSVSMGWGGGGGGGGGGVTGGPNSTPV